MSLIKKKSWKIKQDPQKRKSSIQINQNILNFFRNENSKAKKLSSRNDKNIDNFKNSLYENCTEDYEKKSKAKRCLLYLLNRKSKGTFCPQIIDYFQKIKESKIKTAQLNEIKEENFILTIKNVKKEEEPYKNNLIPEVQKIEKQTEMNFMNYNKLTKKDKDINQHKNNINHNEEFNSEFKNNQNIINTNESVNLNHIKYNNNFNISSQNNNDINPLITIENKNEKIGVSLNENKRKKNSKKKKSTKENKIDMIYNLQKSELQKYGNYHTSLRNAIQSNIGKKKFHKKK